ncbi:OmpA family protein [Sulfurimonas paralvinellae]|uniref:OmpA family protein n=1 Tax=Sulfurimonas paralvinellae TaxID=317658 RepID=A0A7M1BAG5_9BACT|nr:OmpA family protein [Sulfurimonas paralvinellae]QOP45742.1 OmpA family protein [Sulfurimonas paralvinellae]
MLFNDKNKDETNFWISYADLMAGLLFVFILLIGAIVVKSIILKTNLDSKENSLESSTQMLLLRDKELQKLKALLAKRSVELNATTNELLLSKDALELKAKEIENLNNILLSQNMKIDDFNNKIIIMQNLLSESNATIEEQNDKLQNYENKVLILSNELTKKDDTLQLQEKKLLNLLKLIEQKETKYDALIAKLQKQKAQIKNLTGIKIKVISELKRALKDKVEIDPHNGSLRLSSNILFDKGSAHLKESAKKELKKLFINYVGALTANRYIKDHIDRIIIEGHTDSDGGYLFNLNLSQKRAYAVMNYLLTLHFTKKNNLTPLLVASGRSYLDTVKDKNGKEDKSASRRIEIKFSLKNDDAMHEINKILDYE